MATLRMLRNDPQTPPLGLLNPMERTAQTPATQARLVNLLRTIEQEPQLLAALEHLAGDLQVQQHSPDPAPGISACLCEFFLRFTL